ncbi:GNAT family N-acetyltransferase [candidate division KSB1 bacterium]|nr:GNAT family N-acetyltransferase [candidate division KSB1 bacterium]
MGIEIIRVNTKADLKKFVKFPFEIYKNDPYWVPPLIGDQKKFLDKKKGVFFEFGDAEYFLALNNGQVVGRLSAHISTQYEKYHDSQTGFFGFFECIKNQQVANALFSEASKWLKAKQKSRIIGPISFTLYDECAMLYDGFDSIPVVLLSYNLPYYNDLVAGAGFQKAIDWYAFLVSRDLEIRPSFYRIRDRVLKQNGLRIENVDLKRLDEAIKHVGKIFNSAWMENWGHVPLTDGQLKYMAGELKFVAVPELSYLAFLDDECIGFSLTLKDANPALQKANGRLLPFGIFKILKEMKNIKKLRTIAMGVLKEYRNKGLDILFYLNTIENGRKMGFTESECSIIVETNSRMIGALEDLNADRYKTYRLYEKMI